MRPNAIRILPFLAATLLAPPTRLAAAQDPVNKPTAAPLAGRLAAAATVVGVQRADGQIEVHWTPVAGAARSDITRSIAGAGVNLVKPGPSDTTYVDADVKAGFTYYYVVQAVDGAGNPGLKRGSNAVQAKISATPGTQTLRTATPVEETSGGIAASTWSVIKGVTVSDGSWSDPSQAMATVSWDFTQGGVSFIIERALTYPSKGAWQTYLTTRVLPCCSYSTRLGIQGFREGSRIVYRITAVDSANPSRTSVPVTSNEYTISYAQLPAPARFAGVQQADGTIRLTWAPVAGAARYWLRSSASRMMSLAATDTAFVDPDVVAGSYYTYTIDAQGANWVDGIKATTTVAATLSAPTPLAIVTQPTVAASVAVNGTRALQSQYALSNARWVSLDDALATVDAGGTVTGRSPGSARVLFMGVDARYGVVIIQPYRVAVTTTGGAPTSPD